MNKLIDGVWIQHPIDASILYNTLVKFTPDAHPEIEIANDDLIEDDFPENGRILVADDNIDNRSIIKSALSTLPVHIDFVETVNRRLNN